MFAFDNSNTSKNSEEIYLHDLQLYKHFPTGNFQLDKLEIICIQRAKILLYVDKIYTELGITRTAYECKKRLIGTLNENEKMDNWRKIINGASKELGSETEVADQVLQLRRQDHVSHFMLRAAFASHEKKRWFQIQELRLFYWRLYTSTMEEMKEFLRINELKSHDISKDDKEKLKEYIKASNLSTEMPFYKVPFTLVMDLVEMRKVFLKHGMAFIPERELAGLCFGHFKENFALGLYSMPIVAAEAATDFRMNQIFCSITKYITLQKAPLKTDGPSLAELDEVSKISYPLCMRIIHEKLRKTHHLRYEERLQYGLFLKSIGVTLDDAIELWKQEFTKKMDVQNFEREYEYRLRHIYGEAGSKKEYRSYNCSTIMNFNVKPTESYGCPFKHLTNVSLKDKLNEYQIVPGDIEDIVQLSSTSNYEEACKKYYEITHGYNIKEIIHSPVAYFFKNINEVAMYE